jgi:hypothetical protein
MKDAEEVWIVVRTGSTLKNAIVCERGKQQAKELRKEMQQRHGGEWTSKKTTQKELSAV